MAKTYRPYLPEQDFLLPPSPRDWLPEDHLAYFVSDLVDELDLSAITAEYEDEERGSPPYHPLMMTKVLVYAYCVGVFSSRKIQRRLAEDVGFRMLAAGNQPDFRTIADFRKLHLGALTGLFEQGLRMALEAGAVQLGRVALDGTKVQANASKHKAMSYGRMREKVRQLRDEVQQVLTQAEATDADEDARDGSDRRGDDLPAELQRRATRLQRIRAAKRALEVRARDEAAAAGQAPAAAKPEDKAQYNFTDPESRIMHGTVRIGHRGEVHGVRAVRTRYEARTVTHEAHYHRFSDRLLGEASLTRPVNHALLESHYDVSEHTGSRNDGSAPVVGLPMPAQAQRGQPVQLPAGPGQEMVEANCIQCYRLNLIT